MSQSSAFAEALMKNKTKIFFDFLQHKPAWREPVGLEVMGATRSGKSTLSIGVCKFLSKITLVPFTLNQLCPNEIIYLDKLRTLNLPDGASWLVDEQTETHAGAGSYTEMQVLEDIQNICAKKQYNTVWCHPHEFVGRMSQIGLSMFGKNPDLLLLRAIMYNLAEKSLARMPMGIVIFPVGWLFPCGLFGKRIKYLGIDTVITCNKRVCPQYKDCKFFMGQYEHAKDEKIEQVLTQDLHDRELQRLEVIERIANNEKFQQAENNDVRMGIARLLVPFGTPEKLIKEYVSIAKSMNISVQDLKDLKEQNIKTMEKVE